MPQWRAFVAVTKLYSPAASVERPNSDERWTCQGDPVLFGLFQGGNSNGCGGAGLIGKFFENLPQCGRGDDPSREIQPQR
jgi:hypothetical protein